MEVKTLKRSNPWADKEIELFYYKVSGHYTEDLLIITNYDSDDEDNYYKNYNHSYDDDDDDDNDNEKIVEGYDITGKLHKFKYTRKDCVNYFLNQEFELVKLTNKTKFSVKFPEEVIEKVFQICLKMSLDNKIIKLEKEQDNLIEEIDNSREALEDLELSKEKIDSKIKDLYEKYKETFGNL